jgi:hypothetical protein
MEFTIVNNLLTNKIDYLQFKIFDNLDLKIYVDKIDVQEIRSKFQNVDVSLNFNEFIHKITINQSKEDSSSNILSHTVDYKNNIENSSQSSSGSSIYSNDFLTIDGITKHKEEPEDDYLFMNDTKLINE